MSFRDLKIKLEKEFSEYLPEYSTQISEFFLDKEFGLEHSHDVLRRATLLVKKVEEYDNKSLATEVIELIAIFHDIGKFFQQVHSLADTSIAQQIFSVYASRKNFNSNIKVFVLDGIKYSDFYNKRLDPLLQAPRTTEGEIIRAADKMLDNLVAKVDRYWYQYGVSRGARFFDPKLSFQKRTEFSFDNFSGDQLNVILSILGLRPKDFSHPVIREEYRRWSKRPKEKVVKRIVSLATELGEPPEHVRKIEKIIAQYRNTFHC